MKCFDNLGSACDCDATFKFQFVVAHLTLHARWSYSYISYVHIGTCCQVVSLKYCYVYYYIAVSIAFCA